jgi:myo-inositol 2-dehydrogenase / D-chiro-inositol 1-dehydrogenase
MKHRIALFGTDMISEVHAAAAQACGYQVVTVSLDDLVSGRVHVDAVVVTAPPQLHADAVVAFLARGVTTLVETPLCRTLAEADAMVAASDSGGARLVYAESLAHAPVVRALLARIPVLGSLTHLEVRALQGPPRHGLSTSDDWGGGVLFDLGVHPLAVALLCANASGAGRPTSVSARLNCGLGDRRDEHAEVRLQFSTGLSATVVSTWTGGPEPVWDAQLASSAGVLRAEMLPRPSLEMNGDQVSSQLSAATSPIEYLGYLAQMRDLIGIGSSSGSRHESPAMSAAFGRFVLEVVCASYLSAGCGGTSVNLPFSGDRDRTPLQHWRGE